MDTPQLFVAGQIVPFSGLICQVGCMTEVTVVAGEPFPPTQPPGRYWYYVRRTLHAGSR